MRSPVRPLTHRQVTCHRLVPSQSRSVSPVQNREPEGFGPQAAPALDTGLDAGRVRNVGAVDSNGDQIVCSLRNRAQYKCASAIGDGTHQDAVDPGFRIFLFQRDNNLSALQRLSRR